MEHCFLIQDDVDNPGSWFRSTEVRESDGYRSNTPHPDRAQRFETLEEALAACHKNGVVVEAIPPHEGTALWERVGEFYSNGSRRS